MAWVDGLPLATPVLLYQAAENTFCFGVSARQPQGWLKLVLDPGRLDAPLALARPGQLLKVLEHVGFQKDGTASASILAWKLFAPLILPGPVPEA